MSKGIFRTLAMIAVAVFAPYAAAALGLTGVAATVFSLVLQTAVGALLGGDSKAGGGGGPKDEGMLVNKSSNTSTMPVMYGNRRVGGTRVYTETTDAAGAVSGEEYLHVVLAFAQGGQRSDGTDSLSDITKVLFNDKIAWTPDGIMSEAHPDWDADTQTDFSSVLSLYGWLGKNDQGATPDISAGSYTISEEWTSAHQMRGVAYVYAILKYDRDKFPGAPTILIETSGKRIQSVNNLGTYVDTPAEMSNPANMIYDYMTNVRYGKGIPAGDINLNSFQLAHTWANTAGVSLNGALATGDTLYNNLQKLLANSNMNLVFTNGEYYIQPVKQMDFSSAFTFDESNILGSWTITLGNKRSRFNTMKVNYFNPAEEWQPDSVLIENAGYLAADSGVVNEKEVDLQMCSDQTLATKMGTYYLNISRYQKMVSFKAIHSALQLSAGDPVYITHEVPNWTNEKFRVNSITLNSDSTVDVVLEEYAPDSVYLENN